MTQRAASLSEKKEGPMIPLAITIPSQPLQRLISEELLGVQVGITSRIKVLNSIRRE
jgi:hypothetical protein